jgi:catechol 2,3-dioxygenase-like lactoylglutathione lyase family enzyme
MRLNQVTVTVSDVPRAIAFYRALGLELIVEDVHYARFVCLDGGSTFSVHAEQVAPGGSTLVYFECDDLDARVRELEARGIAFESAPRDEPWLWREARLRDPDGNPICLYHAGKNRLDPPWRVAGSKLPGADR